MDSAMIKIIRTNSEHPDFIELVRALDLDLAERDGQEHAFYAQFNKIDRNKFVVLAYDDELPVGCGAIKEYAPDTMEVKRMYTAPTHRDQGIAGRVLRELEDWAAEMSYAKCVLETGKRQPEAIALYQKDGYELIPNYGQYVAVENSVCFEKKLRQE
jgi:GNAT superfamily N-acetyltransferase